MNVKKITGLSFLKLSFKVASAYMLLQSNICLQKIYAKQKHLGCKKVRSQSEVVLGGINNFHQDYCVEFNTIITVL